MSDLDLDELDRLHRAKDAVAILNAYPALAAEVRKLEVERYEMEHRAIEAEALYQPQRESEDLLRCQLDMVRLVLSELEGAVLAYRACREGVQTQGGQNTNERRFTAARLAEALAKVPR